MHAKKYSNVLIHRHGGLCEESGWMTCCTSYVGIVHVGAGVGLGFLIVHYSGLANLALWGWLLVAVAAVGHVIGSMKCRLH